MGLSHVRSYIAALQEITPESTALLTAMNETCRQKALFNRTFRTPVSGADIYLNCV